MQKVDFILMDTLVFKLAKDNSIDQYEKLINKSMDLLPNNFLLIRYTSPFPYYYLIDTHSEQKRMLTYQDQPHLFLQTNAKDLKRFYLLNKPKLSMSEEILKQVALNLTLGFPFFYGFTN